MAALLFILDALLTLVVVAFLLRVLMPLVRADFRNPVGRAVLQVTDPLVRPLRRLVKAQGRVDPGSVTALLLVQVAGTALVRLVAGRNLAPGPWFLEAGRDLLQTTLQFYFIAVLLVALLSWFGPGARNPVTNVLERLCQPLLGPVRRVIPPIGGLDFSALFVLIALQALTILLR
jgi:YggT family protein